MDREDPAMRLVWSPMTHEGQARFMRLRAAIQTVYGPVSKRHQTPNERFQERYARAAKRSADEIFFDAFGSTEVLLKSAVYDEDSICSDIFSGITTTASASSRQAEPEPEPAPRAAESSYIGAKRSYPFATDSRSVRASLSSAVGESQPVSTHVSQLAKPTHIQSPVRASLKRMRSGECSAEKELVVRKPRITLGDTTNLMHSSTTTMSMSNPWDRHSASASTFTKSVSVVRFGAPYQSAFSSSSHVSAVSFVKRASPLKAVASVASTRVFALR